MALYLGNGEKLKININNIKYSLKILTETPVFDGVRLLSSDNYVLKDSNGLHLTVKEDN